MTKRVLSAAVLLGLIACATIQDRIVNADEGPRASDSVTPFVFEIELVIVEHRSDGDPERAIDLSKGSPEIVKRVGELESKGQLASVERIRMTTVENHKAMVQSSRRVPVVTGQVSATRGGPRTSMIESMEVGTLVSVMANMIDRGMVLTLEVEQSRLAENELNADMPGPPEENRLTTQTTVSIEDGGTVVVAAKQTQSSGKVMQQFVLASARVVSGPAGGQAAAEHQRRMFVFPLRFVKADDAAGVIGELIGQSSSFSLAVDSRTNAIVIHARESEIEPARKLLETIDSPDPDAAVPR